MTWPSSTKASTTNVDAGGDKPSLARPDIKQNIDNVNSIIDTFDIATPNNNDYLKYNSTTSKWEPGALSTSNAGTVALLYSDTPNINSGVIGTFTIPISELEDPGNFISISSNQFSLAAGDYLIEIAGGALDTSSSFVVFNLFNVTDNANEPSYSSGATGFRNIETVGNNEARAIYFQLTGTDTYRFQFDATTATNSRNLIIKITKF